MVHLHPYRYSVLAPILSTISLLHRRCSGAIVRVWWLCWWDLSSCASLMPYPLAIFTVVSSCRNSGVGLNLAIARVHVPPSAPNPLLFLYNMSFSVIVAISNTPSVEEWCSGLWCSFWRWQQAELILCSWKTSAVGDSRLCSVFGGCPRIWLT